MSHAPLTLADRDFDAYLPEKASSNAFTRPRLEVKQRALAWARDVAARLSEQGFAAEVHATDEHPSLRNKRRVDAQWVFFWRNEAAAGELDVLLERSRSIAEVIDDPSPYTRHAFLALRIDSAAVEVCFAVHPEAKVDVDNLRARLAEGSEHLAEELAKALHALPDQFEVRAGEEGGDAMRLPCGDATPEQLANVLAQSAEHNVPLWIGWRVLRATVLSHADLVSEQLGDAVLALLPVYQLIAWSRDNDHVGIDRAIEGLQEAQAKVHAEATARGEKWKAEQAEARERAAVSARARAEEAGTGRKGVTLATLFKSATPKEAPRAITPEGAAPLEGGGRPKGRGAPKGTETKAPWPRPDGGLPPQAPVMRADASVTADPGDGSRHGPKVPHAATPGPQGPRVGGAAPLGAPPRNGRSTGPSRPGEGQRSRSDAGPNHKVTFAMRPLPDATPKRDPGAEPTWEKGAKVGIVTGPFAGKVGTIAEMEGNKSARVHLGLLSARLEISNLTLLDASGASRPQPSGAAGDSAVDLRKVP